MKFVWKVLKKWVANDSGNISAIKPETNLDQIDWLRTVPFILLNLSCLLVYWVGFSWVAFLTALFFYFTRLVSIGAFYHRYFSHKTYQTNRFWQFIFGLIGASSVQRGPLWWAAHHRQHHLVADEPEDAHSPVQHGFWWSHVGWFMSKRHYYYNQDRVRDLLRYPELVFLDRYDSLPPAILFVSLFILGMVLQHFFPGLGTSPSQMLVWGFSISTVALFHTTVSINSFSHVFGSKRFSTKDNSRNNFLLAILTFGEGWHNNHHHYPATARQGFYWWEIDMTYYFIKLLEKLGIIWNVKGLPAAVLANKGAKHD